jgi:glycosyltransferase involved in cell wall biosynthesis
MSGVERDSERSRARIDTQAISRVLVVSPRVPWPPRGGLDLRPASVLVALADLGLEVGLATFATPSDELAVPEDVRAWFPEIETDDDDGRDANPLEWVKVADGHPTDGWWTPHTEAALRRALAEFEPQLVILDGLWTRRVLPLVAEAPDRWAVLCAHNVEATLRVELERSIGEQMPAALGALVTRRTAAIEGSVVAAVDQVWACSQDDAGLFRERYPGCAPVSVVPNVVTVPRAARSGADLEHPLLLFVGALTYPPNVDAAVWLVTELMPRLRAIGLDARLRIIGAGAPAKLRELAGDNAVEVSGYVDDLAAHLDEAAIVPVPLVAGGGTRFKVLEAFAHRIPVVSTAKGVEGLDVRAGTHYLAAETAAEFASAIADICSNDPLRAAITRDAYALVENAYAPSAIRDAVRVALAALREEPSRTPSAATLR